MSWQKLKELLSESSDGLEIVKGLEATSLSNVSTINSLETKSSALSTDLSKFKLGNTIVKEHLGIEQLNEDTIKEALSKMKGGKGDEASLAEIGNLKKLLEESGVRESTLTTGYEEQLQEMALTNSLRDIGIDSVASSTRASKLLLDDLKSGAVFENNLIVYKGADGTTLYGKDNKPLTPTQRFAEMQSSEDYSGFFKADVKRGGGAQHNAGSSSNGLSRSKMSHSEKSKYITDNGEDSYLGLPK